MRAISTVTGIARSTLSYMLKEIQLTAVQRERLASNERANRVRFANWSATVERHSWRRPLRTPEQSRAITEAGNLVYLRSEEEIRATLERMFAVRFQKERIGGRYFDFASDTLLIEHTRSGGAGIKMATERFAETPRDGRRRIAFIDTTNLGLKRFRRLAEVGVEVHDIRELETETLAPPTVVTVSFPHRKIRSTPEHGTMRGYRGGCRCGECRSVKSAHNKAHRTRPATHLEEAAGPSSQ